MIQLRLFGAVDVRGLATEVSAEAVRRQPKRLALLAYLAVAGRGARIRRDTILSLFWPQLDQTRARAALRQALHFLRQHLGEDVLQASGDELGICAERLVTDVATFEAALAAERWEEAVAIYRGPLLDALHATGASTAFDEWLLGERVRLHDGARQAIDELGRAAEAREDDWSSAVRWARRAVELDPTHDATTRRLMRLLDRSGDPLGALEAYDRLQVRLQETLGTRPSTRTTALADTVRGSFATPAPRPAVSSLAEPTNGNATRVADAAPTTADGPAAVARPSAAAQPMSSSSRRSGRRWGAALAALVVVAAGGGWWAHGAAPGAHVGQPPVRLAVLPFEEVGEAGDPILAVGMAEVLTTRLASVGQLEVVDPRSAARYRASRLSPEEIGVELDVPFLVRGMVRWTREPDGTSTARLTPMLVSTADGGVRWTGKEYRIEPQRPFAVQAAIAREVTDALGVALTRAERQALVRGPTSDPSAYQYYLQGLDRLREWQNHHHGTEPLPEAAALFARAVERDSTFTLACAKLAEARLHEYLLTPHARSRDPRDLKPFRAAYDHAVRLDPNLPETIAVHGLYLLHVVGDTTRAYQELDRASAMRPSDARLLANRIRYPASLRSLDRDVVLLERALRLDPRSPEALTSLVVILNISRRFAEADHFAVRLTDVDPQNFVGYLHGTRAALRARGDTLRARRFITEGMRRATAPARLLPQFHLLGEDFARALDTLTLAGLRKARPNRVDSLTYYEAKLEAALRLGRSASVRVLADSLLQLAAGESSLHMRGLRATPALAALGRSSEAERALRLNEEHSDAQVRSMFAGGDTVAARSIQGRIGYDMARVYARTGNLTKMAVHLGRALTAPNGVTPYSVRLDPAFFRWHGHPALESALRAAPTTHEPRASTAP